MDSSEDIAPYFIYYILEIFFGFVVCELFAASNERYRGQMNLKIRWIYLVKKNLKRLGT